LKDLNDGTLREDKGMSFEEHDTPKWEKLASVILKQEDKR